MSYVYYKKMIYSPSYSMSMLFLMWTWVLKVASNASKSDKFGFCLIDWPVNMQNELLPVLLHEYAVLDVDLVPKGGL